MQVDQEDMSQSFCRAFALTDHSAYRQGVASGCTACCCVLRKQASSRVVYTAHVGDTRAVLCRSGHAMRLTAMSDHKPTDPTELMRIHSAGGAVVNERVNGVLAM